jgi:hypothetical protein
LEFLKQQKDDGWPTNEWGGRLGSDQRSQLRRQQQGKVDRQTPVEQVYFTKPLLASTLRPIESQTGASPNAPVFILAN